MGTWCRTVVPRPQHKVQAARAVQVLGLVTHSLSNHAGTTVTIELPTVEAHLKLALFVTCCATQPLGLTAL